MAAIYPYKWAGQFPNAESVMIAKEEWEEALRDLHIEQIKKGLSKCRKEGGEFPPSIPEFRKMCLPTLEELGILSEEEAYQALTRGDKNNPLVAQTARMIDMYTWQMMSIKEGRKRFKEVYRLCVDKRMAELEDQSLLAYQNRVDEIKQIVQSQNPLFAQLENKH